MGRNFPSRKFFRRYNVGFGGFLAFAAAFGVFEIGMDSESSSLNASGVPMERVA